MTEYPFREKVVKYPYLIPISKPEAQMRNKFFFETPVQKLVLMAVIKTIIAILNRNIYPNALATVSWNR